MYELTRTRDSDQRWRSALVVLLTLAMLAVTTVINTPPAGADAAGGSTDNAIVEAGSARLDVGAGHACTIRDGLTHDGQVWCWGDNEFGELGIGTDSVVSSSALARKVVGISNATAITAGHNHTCALTSDGVVKCWGWNWQGVLGNGASGADVVSNVPVDVVGLTDVIAITAGASHTCAVRSDGTVMCWGDNFSGQLGNGDYRVGSATPVHVLNVSDAIAIAAGNRHTCAIRSGGRMACWGANSQGQLGNGMYVNSDEAVDVAGIIDATAVASGVGHTCAIEQSVILCWGFTFGLAPTPTTPAPPSLAVSAGINSTCGVYAALLYAAVACWGVNDRGQLGDGSNMDASGPAIPVVGVRDAVAVSSSLSLSCALEFDDSVKCWGRGGSVAELFWDDNVAVEVLFDDRECFGLPITVDIAAGDVPTAMDDVILGTPGDDVIIALDGDDTVCGGGGNDTINGGPGNDTLLGEDGNDTLFGLNGDDVMSGGDGNDSIVGGEGDDRIYANAGKDHLNGGPGNDLILGGSGNDYLGGKEGNDSLSGNSGDDIIQGHGGVDNIDSGPGADYVDGGDAIDFCTVDAADTVLNCP